jgi:hypothetical protein
MFLISPSFSGNWWTKFSADSGLQLDLEIALSVVSAKMQPHELLSPAEDALKRRET